jgi:DNA polymerase III epsilon subunit
METPPLLSVNQISSHSYTFFDFEITGFDPLDTDRIVEIAMIKVINGTIAERYETFINPQRHIPESASNVNHIYDNDVANAPLFDRTMATELIRFIGDSILIAHNAPFDVGFLSMEMARCGINFTSWKYIDSLQIAQRLFPSAPNKLVSLINRYNIQQNGDLHRAMVDTEALVDVFFNLISENNVSNLSTAELIRHFGYNSTPENATKDFPEMIRTSLVGRTPMTCKYTKRTGEEIVLNFQPIAPVWHKGFWYLYAANRTSGGYSFLACQSMKDIEYLQHI